MMAPKIKSDRNDKRIIRPSLAPIALLRSHLDSTVESIVAI